VAYWRHRFILDSAGLAGRELLTEHTFFQGAIQGLAIDLTQPPWDQAQALWTHDSDYRAPQAVARSAQIRGVQWLAYASVRAPGHCCAVVFDPAGLAEPPGGLDATQQTWHCKATAQRVMFARGAQRHGGRGRAEALSSAPLYPCGLYSKLQRINMALAKKKRIGKRTVSAKQVRKTASGRKRRKSDGTQPSKVVFPPRRPDGSGPQIAPRRLCRARSADLRSSGPQPARSRLS
jgi:hypothetical protein